MSSLISPFVSALPTPAVFTQYDADGDAVMTDAATGLPIVYGGSGSKRSRSASLDSDSTDSRPSKRSRTSSDDDAVEPLSPIRIPRAPVGIPVNVCPPAPKKASPPLLPPSDDEEGDISPARNLAEQMAEAVLAGEPAETTISSSSNAAADLVESAPPGGEPPAEPQGWNISVYCSDLALRLDMRHPRVVLNFLRFINTYNELAPYGEEIHLPPIDDEGREIIFSHESVVNPPAEFAADVAELRDLVDRFSCRCPECEPDAWSDNERDDESDRGRCTPYTP
jgi:hypothetical protein